MEYGNGKKSQGQIIAEAAEKARRGETIFNFGHLETEPCPFENDGNVIVDYCCGNPIWGKTQPVSLRVPVIEDDPYY